MYKCLWYGTSPKRVVPLPLLLENSIQLFKEDFKTQSEVQTGVRTGMMMVWKV
jgi:hypothetical protein